MNCPRAILTARSASPSLVDLTGQHFKKLADVRLSVPESCLELRGRILRGIVERQDPALQARVRIISKPNEGLPRARKTGLEAATWEYVLHLDSDDWVEPDAVERLVEEALRTGADLVYFDFWKEYGSRR